MGDPVQRPRANLGCGHIQPEGWINVDFSNRARLAHHLPWIDTAMIKLGVFSKTDFNRKTTLHDLRKRLPWPDSHLEAVYCGEVLEHLKPDEAERLIKDCGRVLAPGGVLRVCVPDVHRFWQKYVAEVDAIVAKPQEEWSDDGPRRYVKGFFGDICVERPWLGSMGHFHKWGYDVVQMVMAFRRAGFTGVERREFCESSMRGVEQVETRKGGFLIVEGSKP